MEIFGTIFSAVLDIFRLDFTVFGFTFSFWDVFVFSIVTGVLAYAIGGFFSGD